MDFFEDVIKNNCSFVKVDESFLQKNESKLAFVFEGKYSCVDLYSILENGGWSSKVNFFTFRKKRFSNIIIDFLYHIFFRKNDIYVTIVLKNDLEIEYAELNKPKIFKYDNEAVTFDLYYYVEHLVKPSYKFRIINDVLYDENFKFKEINIENIEKVFSKIERDFYQKNIFSDMHPSYDSEGNYQWHSTYDSITMKVVLSKSTSVNDTLNDVFVNQYQLNVITEDMTSMINPKRTLEEILLLSVKRYNGYFRTNLDYNDLSNDTKIDLKFFCDLLEKKLGKFIFAFELIDDKKFNIFYVNLGTAVLKFENYALIIYYGNDE